MFSTDVLASPAKLSADPTRFSVTVTRPCTSAELCQIKPSTCIAPCMVKTTLKRSGMDHTVLPATNTMPALPRKRSPDGASTD